LDQYVWGKGEPDPEAGKVVNHIAKALETNRTLKHLK